MPAPLPAALPPPRAAPHHSIVRLPIGFVSVGPDNAHGMFRRMGSRAARQLSGCTVHDLTNPYRARGMPRNEDENLYRSSLAVLRAEARAASVPPLTKRLGQQPGEQ